jgi:hydroxysqualene synthase
LLKASRPRARSGDNALVGVDHYENFPVASWLCPRALRPAVAAIYWFARTADDIADEGDATPLQRLSDLAEYGQHLDAALTLGQASSRWPAVFAPLAAAHRKHNLPLPLLHDLLSAFEQDVRNPPYADRPALLDYCRRSANPVGRLLLHLYGMADERDLRRSDAICSALQLINFWQDLGVDQQRGRNYLPATDMAAHGLGPLPEPGAAQASALRATVRSLCEWAGQLMRQGAPLALGVPGRAGWELRLVVQGGLRILDKIAQVDHDTLNHRPTVGRRDVPLLLWRAFRMSPERAA